MPRRRRASPPDSGVRARLSELAAPTERAEILDTPAPYTWDDTRDNRKIPYVFRTTVRFPPPAPALGDALDCNRRAVEPAPKVAVISCAPRWAEQHESDLAAKQYDVERGVQATEPKAFAATFTTQPRPEPRPASPHMPNQEHLTISHSHVKGGKFSTQQRRTDSELVVSSPSPGPIYNPSFRQVDAKPTVAVFSTQPRDPVTRTLGPGPLSYADAAQQVDHLSTRRRSPGVRISDVPNASSMPFPYNMANVCNSRSMRTDFCATRSSARSPTRPPRPASSTSTRRSPTLSSTREHRRPPSATPPRSLCASAIAAPFSATPTCRAVSVVSVSLGERDSQGEVAADRPHTAAVRTPQCSDSSKDRPAYADNRQCDRFSFASKYPLKLRATVGDGDDHKADGVMAELIAQARSRHPEGTLEQRRARVDPGRYQIRRRPWSAASRL